MPYTRKPVKTSKPPPKKPKQKKDELFDEVQGKIKDGGLRKSLKLKEDDKPLKKSELQKIEKTEDGKLFSFRSSKIKMTPKLKKQLNLAINMMGGK